MDLRTQLNAPYSPATGLSDDFLNEGKKHANTSSSPPKPLYSLKKENILGSKISVKDGEGTNVAEWSNPITSLGKNKFTFLAESPHSSHDIEIKSLGVGRRAESFVVDSVLYIWEVERFKVERKSLFKVSYTCHLSVFALTIPKDKMLEFDVWKKWKVADEHDDR